MCAPGNRDGGQVVSWFRVWLLAVVVSSTPWLALPACAIFGPSDVSSTSQSAQQIVGCQSKERDCLRLGGAGSTCYGLSDTCVRDAGLR